MPLSESTSSSSSTSSTIGSESIVGRKKIATSTIQIVLGENAKQKDAFCGTLKCRVSSGGSDCTLDMMSSSSESEFTFVRTAPLTELRTNGISYIVKQDEEVEDVRPSKTNENTHHDHLDFVTINILLKTMKSGMILSQNQSTTCHDGTSGRQQQRRRRLLYVYQPKTATTATLTTFNTATMVPKSRLAKATINNNVATACQKDPPVDSIDRKTKDTLKSLDTKDETSNEASEAYTKVTTMEDLEHAMKSCVDMNDPTPQHVMTQLLPSVLLTQRNAIESNHDNDNNNNDMMTTHELLVSHHIWMTPATLLEDHVRHRQTQNDSKKKIGVDTDDDQNNNATMKIVRHIQLQSLLRLQLLAMNQHALLELCQTWSEKNDKKKNKKKMDKKKNKKRKGSMMSIIMEITTILESASFLMSINQTMYSFLCQTIPQSLHSCIPKTIQEVFDHFECPNPFLVDDTNDINNNDKSNPQHTDNNKDIENNNTEQDGTSKMVGVEPPLSITLPLKKKVKLDHCDDGRGSGAVVGDTTKVPFEDSKPNVQSSKAFLKEQHQEKEDILLDLTKNRSSFTIKRCNPLIKDAKAKYVGSHFGTKHTHYHLSSTILPTTTKLLSSTSLMTRTQDRNKNSKKSSLDDSHKKKTKTLKPSPKNMTMTLRSSPKKKGQNLLPKYHSPVKMARKSRVDVVQETPTCQEKRRKSSSLFLFSSPSPNDEDNTITTTIIIRTPMKGGSTIPKMFWNNNKNDKFQDPSNAKASVVGETPVKKILRKRFTTLTAATRTSTTTTTTAVRKPLSFLSLNQLNLLPKKNTINMPIDLDIPTINETKIHHNDEYVDGADPRLRAQQALAAARRSRR